jgi:hypothetical protein
MPDPYLDQHKYELDQAKFGLDKERLALDTKRADLEEEKAIRERSFFQRNAGPLITGMISVATVSVSAALVIVSFLQYKQTGIIERTKLSQTKLIEDTKLAQSTLETKRKSNYDALIYLTSHELDIYACAPSKQDRLIKLMNTAFLPDVMTQVIDELKKICPDKKTGPTLKKAERDNDNRSVNVPIQETQVSLPPNILDIQELEQQLTSPSRREVSNGLIAMYPAKKTQVVKALIDSILPQSDPRSYRHNLYVAFTLARIPGGWKSTQEQKDRIYELSDSNRTQNAKDPTFSKWTKQALIAAKVAK